MGHNFPFVKRHTKVDSELARIAKLFTDDPEPPVRTVRLHSRHYRKNRKSTNSEELSIINEILDTENEEVLPFHARELEMDPLSWRHFVYRRPMPVSQTLGSGHALEDLERLQVVKAEKRPHVYSSTVPKEAMQTEILDPFVRAPLGGKPVPSYYAPKGER